jgi:hypothetical protein
MPTKHNMGSEAQPSSDAVARIEALEALCGELYQVLGNAGASEQVLDKVWAAANGDPIPDVKLLPSKPMDFGEVRKRQETIDQIVTYLAPSLGTRLGKIGGSRSTEAKRQAARLNGRKGGRPRKEAR